MAPIKKNFSFLAVVWTCLLATLLFLNVREAQKAPIQHAETQASSLINSAISFRNWASHFGGVYVHPTDKYPPNPHLKTPKRDITTTDGEKLTLINPAYMTRQVFDDFPTNDGVTSHLSSLKPLNPNNRPDTWERESLLAFEQGSKNASIIDQLSNGQRILRYMQPLYVEKSCLACHGDQNYKIGEVRGGISIRINLKHSDDITAVAVRSLFVTYGLIWLIGLAGIFVSYKRALSLESEREQKSSLLNVSENLAQNFISEISTLSNLEASLQAISTMLEKRDPYTAGHQQRVADLAERIALTLGLPADQVHGIRLAALVHDIGKIQVPAEVLNKPGKLTDLEYSLIKLHPQTGYDILKGIKFPWPIAQTVLLHHERLDGSGYPQGLKSEQIILDARIIAVADIVESMSSHRPYRPSLGLDAALDEITKQRNVQLDAQVVDTCLQLFKHSGYQFP